MIYSSGEFFLFAKFGNTMYKNKEMQRFLFRKRILIALP